MSRFRLKALTAAAVAIYAGPAFAQDAPPESTTRTDPAPGGERAVALPQVRVEDTVESPYKANTVSSPKFTQPLIDTPQTITVIKKEVIAEQGALSLTDALRNTPGITFQLGENGNTASGDTIFLRGFDTQGSIFLDNIRDIGASVRDVFNVEQIEIVKGPAGADNGRGIASGYINLVSKTPFADDARSGSLSYGTEERRRITADLNQVVGEHTAVRINLLGQDGGVAGRDVVERRQWGIAPSVAFGLGTPTRVTLFSQHIRQDNTPDGGVSAIGISGYRFTTLEQVGVDPKPVDRGNYYGLNSDFEDLSANLFTARIEHDLLPGITLRNLSRYGKSDQKRILSAPLQAPTVSDGTGAALVIRADPDTWTQGRNRQASYRENQILTNQTSLRADFHTGAIEHNLTSGVEFIYESQFTPTYAVTATTPAQVQTPANLYHPSRDDPAVSLSRNGVFADGDTTTAAVYVFDTIKLDSQWQVNGGVRWERYDSATDSTSLSTAALFPALPVGTLVPAHIADSDNLLSWKAGVLFKPLPNGSIYVAYANSLRPPGGDNFTLAAATSGAAGTANANINSPALDPQKAINTEVGTKWDFMGGRLGLTAALFQSKNKNDLARADDDGSVRQYGERKVEGVELGAVGQLLPNWNLTFGYTFQDTEVSKGAETVLADGTVLRAQDGNAIQFSPKNSATLWTTYKLPIPLTIGGGARYVDTQARTVSTRSVDTTTGAITPVTTGILQVKDYTVFDAVATYDITPNLGAQLNVYNIADKDYVASVNNSGQRYFPGTPRSYLVTVNLRF